MAARFPPRTVSQAAAIQILGVFGDSVAFSYETFGGDSGNPPYGPILVVNLATQTGQLVDPDINTLSFQDPRAWAHRSRRWPSARSRSIQPSGCRSHP